MVKKLWAYRIIDDKGICDRPSNKGPSDTNYTISQNGTKYVEFCVQDLLSLSCKMLPIKLFIDGKNFTVIARLCADL